MGLSAIWEKNSYDILLVLRAMKPCYFLQRAIWGKKHASAIGVLYCIRNSRMIT